LWGDEKEEEKRKKDPSGSIRKSCDSKGSTAFGSKERKRKRERGLPIRRGREEGSRNLIAGRSRKKACRKRVGC